MTDLNELTEFERNLKKLIDERNQPMNIECLETKARDFSTMQTYMVVQEHGQPFTEENSLNRMSYMVVPEHGQPYTRTTRNGKFVPIMTESGYRCEATPFQENGRTIYRVITKMRIKEHGQPFVRVKKEEDYYVPIDDNRYDAIPEDLGHTTEQRRRMEMEEHGRPYGVRTNVVLEPMKKGDVFLTDMCIPEHGRPYK